MKITSLWIVTKPTPRSQLVDILFPANACDLQIQFLGGLQAQDIHGMYTEVTEARKEAERLLAERVKP